MNISEAQALYAINRLLKGCVSVPEVYGCRTDGEEKYIYMEYIQGESFEEVWDTMDIDDHIAACHELGTIFGNLRQLEQDPMDKFVDQYIYIPC